MSDKLGTGNVISRSGKVTARRIITGFRHLNPQAPDREGFVAELKALRDVLAELQKQPEAAADAQAAASSLDDAIAEAQKKEPLRKLGVNRLRNTVEFITDAGKQSPENKSSGFS
jgi:hypothetical protein